MDFPKVSILICTYNRSHLLKRAIQSVLKQTYKNIELIVIDDCSTDNTANIINSIHDDRLRYIRNEVNAGSVHGDRAHVQRFINELMVGEYFVYLCDDDYWLNNNLLERQVAEFKTNNNLSMVIGGQLSHFIPSGCDLYLLEAKNTSTKGLSLNGCFSWYNGKFAFVSPVNKITYIDVDGSLLNTILAEKIAKEDYVVQNKVKKFHLSDEEITKVVSEKETSKNIYRNLPPVNEIPKISYKDLHNKPIPRTVFISDLYPKSLMTSKEFLNIFSADPTTRNMIVGATLYSKKHFTKAGAMASKEGSKWQAGYEFLLGPACIGDVAYFDEPCIVVEVRTTNASFQGTQVDHYLDCLVSINKAFETPLKKSSSFEEKAIFIKYKKETIRNVTRSFLSNSLWVKLNGELSACSKNNIQDLVLPKLALKSFMTNKVSLKPKDIEFLIKLILPFWLLKPYQIIRG